MYVALMRVNDDAPWRLFGVADGEIEANRILVARRAQDKKFARYPSASYTVHLANQLVIAGATGIEAMDGQVTHCALINDYVRPLHKSHAVEPVEPSQPTQPTRPVKVVGKAAFIPRESAESPPNGERKRGRQPGSKRCPGCNRIRILVGTRCEECA